MTQTKNNKILSIVHSICCGIDVHKEIVVACCRLSFPLIAV